MPDSPFTGLTASIKLGTSTAAEAIGYISGCTLDLSKDIIEILGFGMQYKEKVPAIKDWTLSMDGTAAFSTGGSQEKLLKAFDDGTAITVSLYLDSKTYFEGTGYVSSLSIAAAPDDKISISGEVAGSGAVTSHIGTGV